MYVRTCMSVCVYVGTMYVCVWVCVMYVCFYVCMHVCMYVCMCVCTKRFSIMYATYLSRDSRHISCHVKFILR